ncbi:condensation domain-containing protein [Micromonospora foliorum]|uniref:condensation domain-containing protein n=1 Tax=Micromonospora foliorum TaxID=2911210 RepID=UPI001EE9AAC5|nr:condensation domain-containing protein [Micromonospora foliorum]MCG5439826.1 condensation domain-containing protein [Micromonospora foliorum]
MVAGNAENVYPLTMGQFSLWQDAVRRPAGQRWESNMNPVWSVPPGIGTDKVRWALAALADRHESLRTHYVTAGGSSDVRQVVAASAPAAYQGTVEQEQWSTMAAEQLRLPFDLTQQAPWRAWAVQKDGLTSQVQLVVHHLAADGAALAVLQQDFQSLIESRQATRPAPTPRGLAARQREPVYVARLAAAAEYREQTIAAAPQEAGIVREGLLRACAHTGISFGLARRTAQRLEVTLPNLLFAAYSHALAGAAGGDSPLLCLLSANRLEPSVRNLVSSMTQWVPVRSAGDAGRPFAAVAADANINAIRALQHGIVDPATVAPLDLDRGCFFTFVSPPPGTDAAAGGGLGPSRIEWLPPRGRSGPSFYLIASVFPEVSLTLRVMRSGYEREDLERLLSSMTTMLRQEATR